MIRFVEKGIAVGACALFFAGCGRSDFDDLGVAMAGHVGNGTDNGVGHNSPENGPDPQPGGKGGGAGAGSGGTRDASGGNAPSDGGASSMDQATNAGDATGTDDASGAVDAVSELDAPGPDVAPARKRVFVTRDRFDGNLKLAADDAGANVATGLAAGDALCNMAASAASLGGTWIAWLSDSTSNAIDRIEDVGPWYRLDGVEIFENKAALVGNPLDTILLNETGGITDLAVWTGTLANGTNAGNTCRDWTSNSSQAYGLCGYNNTTMGRRWSEGTTPLCAGTYNLYCFEQ